ncbi:glycolate oxidase iron-sulfur subunit [Carboxydocella thermautotrophica]|nr:glycolate oxidase iron-sulfur subunit [Carboxydocella thermautotrophica]
MLAHEPELLNQLKKCVRCGQCRSVCPVFAVLGKESAAPRGKVFLTEMLHKEKLPLSEEMAGQLTACLLCEACSQECPSGIPVHRYVSIARSHLAKKGYYKFKRQLFGKLWPRTRFLSLAGELLKAYQHLGIRSLARGLGLTRLLPGSLGQAEAVLTTVPRQRARQLLPTVTPAQGEKRGRVYYFLGCATDMLFPHIAQATVKALSQQGFDVVISPELNCCGMPQLGNGARDTAVSLAARVLEQIETAGAQWVVSDCASCGAALKEYPQLLAGTELAATARTWAERTREVTAFLAEQGLREITASSTLPLTVTIHDPCHLARGLKQKAALRLFLQQLPGVEVREMAQADRCCGGAGTFFATNYQLSQTILAEKVANIRQSGAQVVVTPCPGCILQISHGLRQQGLPVLVKHPVELLTSLSPRDYK